MSRQYRSCWGITQDHGVVQSAARRIFRKAYACGGVALRIGVDNKRALARSGKRSGEVDGSSGFAHAAFLIGNSNNSGQLAHQVKDSEASAI